LIFGPVRSTVDGDRIVNEDSVMTTSPSMIHPLTLRGVIPALVTPFTKDGAHVDTKSLGALIEKQIAGKVHGVVACGSTGEASTLSEAEYFEVVKFTREMTRGKVPCVAGISVSSTHRAVQMAREIKEVGCDAILVATPPYNKPSQAGIIEHFKAIQAASGLPLIAYNVPGRSGVAITPITLGTLSQQGIISAIKEASGSVDLLADTMLTVRADCQVLSGDDSLFLATLAYGGRGVISVVANACPEEMVALYNAFERGDTSEACRLQLGLLPRIRAAFIEANPVPIKTALARMGVIANDTVRLPLTPLAPANFERVCKEYAG
jgi:4-hydroxy-tetrahydrodipicolinate synthase